MKGNGVSRRLKARRPQEANKKGGIFVEEKVDASMRRAIEQHVLARYAPVHVVVDGNGEAVHFSADTDKFFDMPAGSPTRQIVAAVRQGLRFPLERALREAAQSGRTVVKERVPVERKPDSRMVRLHVEPLPQPSGAPLYLVLLDDLEPASGVSLKPDDVEILAELEAELTESHRRLMTTIEEYEAALEALRAANEELLCANEEVQASQEESDLSNEELQSLNEELNTINEQLSEKIAELDGANDDLRNLLDSALVATVFLDRELQIRNFTRAATAIFRLIPGDCGRPLADIVHGLDAVDLPQGLEDVLESGAPMERRVHSSAGADYLMRLAPYRYRKYAIEGVVATFIDVTAAAV